MEDIPISLEKTKSCERYMTSELFKGKKQPVLSQDDVALPTTTFLRTYFEKDPSGGIMSRHELYVIYYSLFKEKGYSENILGRAICHEFNLIPEKATRSPRVTVKGVVHWTGFKRRTNFDNVEKADLKYLKDIFGIEDTADLLVNEEALQNKISELAKESKVSGKKRKASEQYPPNFPMFQIFEDEDYVYVNAFIPGRPSISLNCTESKEVFLLGEIPSCILPNTKTIGPTEFVVGKFRRKIPLPSNIEDVLNPESSHKDGILTLKFKRTKQSPEETNNSN